MREVSTPEAFDDACGSSALCVVAFIGGDEEGENARDAERAVIRAVAAETSD